MGRVRRGSGRLSCPVCDEDVLYSYYYDPGRYDGPPERCYPEESEVELTPACDCEWSSEHYLQLEREALSGASDDFDEGD